MSSRSWRWGAFVLFFATAVGFLATRLVFAPVPWPDGSAFYLPGLELIHWPPQWRMHAQAAFVPSYDEANFNLMPALPLLLGIAGRSGLLHVFNPELLIRIVSVTALLAWAWLLWSWLTEALSARFDPARARLMATAIALAGLWDPVLRWGTLVVRTETWIGLGWVWILRELHRWELRESQGATPQEWNRTAWRVAAGLAVTAYFHFEAIYFVPAVIVGLGSGSGWFKRLVGVGTRTALLLSPWLLYVVSHLSLFFEQLQIQFYRLAHGNHWMANPYMIFHSLFIDHGSPSGNPKFFNVAKGLFWAGLLTVAAYSLSSSVGRKKPSVPRRALLASAVAFACCFYLWATKAEVWFITLCHLVYWPWVGAALTSAPSRLRKTLEGLGWSYAVISLAASFAQARAISPDYTWDTYQDWVTCIERALGPLDAKPGLKLWQPHVPDILVELSRRHPDWDVTRTLDFPARTAIALQAVKRMDALVFTLFFNPPPSAPRAGYFGPSREPDRIKMSNGINLPFGPWALGQLPKEEPGRWETRVCEVGPFWASIVSRHGD